MDLLYVLDLLGTLAFAMSGVFAARENQLDAFGAFVLAFITAIGGGTLRDTMIGSLPVGWMQDVNYLWAIGVGYLLAIFFSRHIQKLSKTLFLFDAIGIGVFTILGLEKTLSLGLSPIIGVLMGVVSATFGGVIRDVLTGRVPLILREEIYATACVAGGLLYLVLRTAQVPTGYLEGIAILFVVALRIVAVRFHLSMPRIT